MINALDESVLKMARMDLDYHETVFSQMGLDNRAKMVVHVGGGYGDPAGGLDRFAMNVERSRPEARARLAVENDDRICGAADVLALCR